MSRQLTSVRAPLLALATALTLAFSLIACGGAQKTASASAVSALPATAVCPVSKEKFKPTAATKTAVYKGKTYYMCCGGCSKKFAANPEKYVGATAAKPAKPCDGACDKPGVKKDCPDCKKPAAAAGKKPCGDCAKPAAKKDCADCKKPGAKPCADCAKAAPKKDCGDCKKPGVKKDCADCKKPGAKPCADCEKPAAKPAATAAALPATAVCPVTGKTFKPTAATQTASHGGKTYYMCCGGCAKKFAAAPAKYAK